MKKDTHPQYQPIIFHDVSSNTSFLLSSTLKPKEKMKYEDGSFDCIIDKACLDAILCGENSAPNSKLLLDEIYRVLSPNGVYICVSYGLPDMRLVYFNKYDWKTTI